MESSVIVYPVLALVGWTFGVVGLVGWRRSRVLGRGTVRMRDFALGEPASLPAPAVQANRNLVNLLEVPVLFYVVGFAFHATGTVDAVAVTLAWLFVVLRMAHTIVHVTYNRVLHRFTLFAAGNATLLVLWLYLVVRLV